MAEDKWHSQLLAIAIRALRFLTCLRTLPVRNARAATKTACCHLGAGEQLTQILSGRVPSGAYLQLECV